MKKLMIIMSLMLATGVSMAQVNTTYQKTDAGMNMDKNSATQVVPSDTSIYDFKVKTWDGQDVSMSKYHEKIILIVNTATECGFTPQYKELEAIYEEYKDRGFEILDFPCNQFGEQAPGSDKQINEFCMKNYGITFPRFAKVEVNGDKAMPMFRWLENQAPFKGFDEDCELTPVLQKMLDGSVGGWKEGNSIKWNFTKFLVDREGNVLARFEPTANLDKIRKVLNQLM